MKARGEYGCPERPYVFRYLYIPGVLAGSKRGTNNLITLIIIIIGILIDVSGLNNCNKLLSILDLIVSCQKRPSCLV